MEKNNLEIWNNLKAVPAEAKKKIIGGRLKGMTDIKPQWRLKMMTEQFGVIGIGWYYEIVETWTEEHETKTSDSTITEYKTIQKSSSIIEKKEYKTFEIKPSKETLTNETNREISVHVHLHLFIKDDKEWSKPIVGIGGSMLLAKEKYGTHHSDEAYKMATTDALSVAMKQLGVAADVYMGLSDSKYDKPAEEQPQRQEQPKQITFASKQQREDLNKYLRDFQDNNDTKAIDYINEALVAQNLTALEATTIISHCKTKLGEK